MTHNEINADRFLLTALREIAQEQGLQITTFSHHWIVRLSRETEARHVFGYNFELNSATAQMLAGDKSAASDLLEFSGVPCIEHRLFLRSDMVDYVPSDGNWLRMMGFAEEHGWDVVCKNNVGTGGAGVTRVRSPVELEQATRTLFKNNHALAISPFVSAGHEYRLIMLDGKCLMAYAKKQSSITGDGCRTLRQLLSHTLEAGTVDPRVVASALVSQRQEIDEVLPEGVRVVLDWRHNLKHGSIAVDLREDDLDGPLTELAADAADALNLRFAAVDIVETGNTLRVLEVNSGVMMETYARSDPARSVMAKAVYAKAVESMFR